MKLTRDEIIGGDFAQAVDGWHRADVLRHLDAIAAAVEELRQSGDLVEQEEGEGARREAEALLAAARIEADTVRAQAAEEAERQMAQAQLAVKDLLERVASLNLCLEEARRAVEERGSEIARRIEESAEPFIDAMRERAEALGAEVALMATGVAMSARAATEPEAQREQPLPGAQDEPAGPASESGSMEAEPEPVALLKPEPVAPLGREPRPEAGTGLGAGDLEEAAEQLAADSAPEPATAAQGEQPGADPSDENGGGGQAGRERARLIALNMALGGASEEEAERRLREDLGIDDPAEILADAYGRAPESR